VRPASPATSPAEYRAVRRAAPLPYCFPVGTALGEVGWVFSFVVSVAPPVWRPPQPLANAPPTTKHTSRTANLRIASHLIAT